MGQATPTDVVPAALTVAYRLGAKFQPALPAYGGYAPTSFRVYRFIRSPWKKSWKMKRTGRRARGDLRERCCGGAEAIVAFLRKSRRSEKPAALWDVVVHRFCGQDCGWPFGIAAAGKTDVPLVGLPGRRAGGVRLSCRSAFRPLVMRRQPFVGASRHPATPCGRPVAGS